MNIISFDIEEWYLEKVSGRNSKEIYAECDAFLDKILQKLDETHTKATFFCVGGMAREFPQVIKKIDAQGHEIGCHSDVHTWLNKMSLEEFKEDTHRAVDSLRQCIGGNIISYRAPAFTIDKTNPWAFKVLYDNGIRMDSSIFPAHRDYGGYSNFGTTEPCVLLNERSEIKEFPISLTTVMGKQMGYSGGGYFRLFPYWFIKKTMTQASYAISYFHVLDLMPEKAKLESMEKYEAYYKEKGTLLNRYKRHIKTNLGKAGALNKMNKLLDTMSYVNIAQANEMIDWDKAQRIIL